MDVEGRERTGNLLWVETLLLFSKLEAFSVETWENAEEVGEASVLCPLLTISVTCFSSPGSDFVCNCFSQGSPDEKSTGEFAASPIKHGEEKPAQREPQKTLGQTRQRHRDEKSRSSTRHGSGRVWQGLRIFRLKIPCYFCIVMTDFPEKGPP